MAPHRPRAATAPDPHLIPPALTAWLSVFRSCFTAPMWNRVLVLVAGAVLAPGKRTVTQALRVMGLAEEPQFRRYHEVLGRARWDSKVVARRLLLHLLDRLLPDGPVVIGALVQISWEDNAGRFVRLMLSALLRCQHRIPDGRRTSTLEA